MTTSPTWLNIQATDVAAALGYCFGGLLAYHALADATVDAASAYYGGGIEHQLGRAGAAGGPLQLHSGASDAHIPAAAVSSIAERFGARANVEIHVCADAGHGFNCPYRDTYLQRASAQAHGNTLIFLSEAL